MAEGIPNFVGVGDAAVLRHTTGAAEDIQSSRKPSTSNTLLLLSITNPSFQTEE